MAMEADGIVPNIIDKAPSAQITIKYPSGKQVLLGKELAPADVQDEPELSWDASPEKFYTVIFIDPDVPKEFSHIKHWLVVNIKGSEVSSGDVIASYVGSRPRKDTGFHKYIFLLYEQTGKLDFSQEPRSAPLSRTNRIKWNMMEFIEKYGLKALAWNYYKAQWDESVDQLRESVKD